MRSHFSLMVPLMISLGACSKAPVNRTPAPGAGIPNPPTDAVIPTDPSVRMGVLDNGLHWYVEENGRPKERATLRLAVKVGSVMEDDDQQGLAHFLEHMAFNGTENFQGNALINYMESIGMEFGAHLNAYTSFDETVYLLTVPTDQVELLDTGLAVLRDQAGNMLLRDEDIEAERGVVLEEWRLSLGAGQRIQKQIWANAFPDIRYSARFPIGTEDSLQGFSPDALRRFYADWYRPELMAVIAVGDFDGDRVQASIESLFSDLENPEDARPRGVVDIPSFEEERVFVVTDPEATTAFVLMDDQYDGAEGPSWQDYYDDHLLPSLLYFVANERLADHARDPEGAVAGAQLGPSRINRAEEETSLSISVRGDRTLEALASVGIELERLRRHGVTASELERAKASVSAQYEDYGKTAATTDSNTHADELQRVFLAGEGMPGIAVEVAAVEAWLPGITVDEINSLAGTVLKQGSQLVQVVVPEREGFTVPEIAQVRAALEIPADADLSPLEDTATDGPLVAHPPSTEGGQVVQRSEADAVGVTTLVLSNGVRVRVMPTDFADDEVVLTARSRGGLSLVDDDLYGSARVVGAVLSNSGLGAFDAEGLSKRMAGVRATASAGIDTEGEWVRGGAAADQVETMLQLVWLHFTEPRFTEEGEARTKAGLHEMVAAQARAPGRAFQEALQEAMVGKGLRQDPMTTEDVDGVKYAQAQQIWEARFADAADFEWMIVGDLELETVEPMLARWLGQLPVVDGAPREQVDAANMTAMLEGSRDVRVEDGTTPRAQVVVVWHGPSTDSWLARNRMMALADVVSGRLRGVLREDLGGVYGVSLRGGVSRHPTPHYQMSLSFACDPERVEELLSAAQDQFDDVMRDGVSAEEIAVEQEQNRRDRQERVRSNSFWGSAYVGTLLRGEDPADLLSWDARNDSLNSDELRTLAQTVWGGAGHRVQAVWVPASGQ